MIGVSTLTYDLDGSRVFYSDRSKDLKNRMGERRISRTGTLDGGVVIADMGFTDGDRDIIIEVLKASIEDVDFARYICETYNLVTVTTEDGAYKAAPSDYKDSDGTLKMTMLVSEKVS
jgi:hypothetical protein